MRVLMQAQNDGYKRIDGDFFIKNRSLSPLGNFEKIVQDSSMPPAEKVRYQMRHEHPIFNEMNRKIPVVSADNIKGLKKLPKGSFIINFKTNQNKLTSTFNAAEMFFKGEAPAPNRKEQFYEYNQGNQLIVRLNDNDYKTLNNFMNRFGGLCELVCNQVLKNRLLGREGQGADFLMKNIHLDNINKKEIKESHLADTYSFFSKILAFFGYYTGNFFSHETQRNMVTSDSKLNREGIRSAFEDPTKIPVDKYLKVEVFWKEGLSFGGHSLLIMKTGEDASGKGIYSFFDPNQGEFAKLTFDEVCDKLDEQLQIWKKFNPHDILFLDGDEYLKNKMKQ